MYKSPVNVPNIRHKTEYRYSIGKYTNIDLDIDLDMDLNIDCMYRLKC